MAAMSRDYILSNLLDKKGDELYLSPKLSNHGRFEKGHKPWNKGMTWEEMGISREEQNGLRRNLLACQGKGNPNIGGWNARPVIAIDEYGFQVHWYKSSVDAAKKLGLIARNIRRACVKGYFCGDFRWKFDERFK